MRVSSILPSPRSWRRGARAAAAALSVAATVALAPVQAQAQSVIRDTEIEGILRSWSDPVFTAMGLPPDDVTMLLIDDPSLNAFATVNQTMGLNTGIILEADSPNELLGVIAHEGGHIRNRHVLRNGAREAGMQPMIVSMALGALAVAAGAPSAGAALLGSSGHFGTIGALQYLQSQEGEADLTGARALDSAGVSAQGLVDFFEKFRAQEVFSDARRYPYFRSHPLSSQRIENLRRPVAALANHDAAIPEARVEQLALMQAKIRGFMNAPTQTYRTYTEADQSLPARYARTIAWYKDGQMERALAGVDVLIAEQPENPYFQELKGQILFEGGRPADAVPFHARSVALAPEAPLLRINLAHALIETNDEGRLDEAVTELKRSLAYENDNPLAWRLLAQAYGTQGLEGEARLASAEFYYAMGRQEQATQFALRARDMLQPGTNEWRRAVDIVLASGATPEDLQELDQRQGARQGG
ncbi:MULTISPECIES: M48 family metalloprotease [Brevundimonas]|uniref:M48 family metalloprotease n=1 Tax=Brevundimonas TaxID=41275 RepID=UPI000F0303D9|nr:M48 family metalloprotease [Brevundimonas lutea]